MRLARFIRAESKKIISEWETFAKTHVPAASTMTLDERRDHIAGMLQAVVRDLDTPQTKREQARKSKGTDDAHVDGKTAANAHGTDRAATGYTPAEMGSEFRALRASVLRLWSDAPGEFSRVDLDDVTRFNESIDQLLAESLATYARDVERAKDLFLGVLGHDLRNPLGAIMMSASLMMTQEGPNWTHARTASRMLRSGTRMDEMIRDLLDFTRSRLGTGIPVVRVNMDLRATCRQTIDELTAFHPRSKVHLEVTGNVRGEWDAGRIGQVLSNLIGNAYQHGLASAPVEVVLRGKRDRVLLTVHNKGQAIAKKHLRAIFDPFRQVSLAGSKASDLRSAGLGLYIAQAIVNAHHGTIEVESTKRGTTFTVCLPRRVSAGSASRS